MSMSSPRRSWFVVVAVALVMALVGTACGGTDDDVEAIRLQGNAVGGGQLYYEDLAAQDTVLWFWAPW